MKNIKVTKSQGHKVTSKRIKKFLCPCALVPLCTSFIFIIGCLILPQSAQAATYYLDASVSSSGDGTSWSQAKKTWAEMDALLDALGNGGAGDTVEVKDGSYGALSGGVLIKPRTDWLTIKAVAGCAPVFSYIKIDKLLAPAVDVYLKFDGITITPGDTAYDYRGAYGHYVNYVQFKNMTFVGPGVAVYMSDSVYTYGVSFVANCSYCEVNNCTISGYRKGVLVAQQAGTTDIPSNINISYNTIHSCEQGIQVVGHYMTITHNTIYDIYSDGILPLCDYSDISHNTIHDIEQSINYTSTGTFTYTAADHTIRGTGSPFTDWSLSSSYLYFVIMTVDGVQHSKATETGSGAWAHITSIPDTNTLVLEAAIPSGAWVGYTGGDLTITKIEGVGDAHMDGIQTFMSSDVGSVQPAYLTITNNKIYNLGKYTWSNIQGMWIAGKGTVDYPADHITIENNLIYSHRSEGARTIGTWGPVTHLVFRNNTVATTRSVEFNTQTQADTVTGNLVYNLAFVMTSSSVNCTPVTDAVTVTDCNNNIIHQWGTRMCIPFTGYGTHNSVTGSDATFKALFNNYDANDFTLASGSQAINFIGDNSAPAADILGIPRDSQPDAGCYEYIPESATLYGDVSGEGEVSAYDAALTAQAAVGLITLTADQTQAADVTGEGEISAYDAALIAQRAVGLIDKFPVEK